MSLSNIFRRTLHTAAANCVRRKANPGIGIQTQVFQREGLSTPGEFDDFEEMESDFMDLHKTHKQHEREIQEQHDQMRRWIVKNKYFNEKHPNFLTYGEKEQIKLLNARDPEEWTVEKLAESFPATTEIISKIIRAKWTAKSAKRIKLHDEAVLQNWESLRKGQLTNINLSLKEHLTKFAFRQKDDLVDVPKDLNLRPALPRPKSNDFLNIITSCKGYADKEPVQKMITDASSAAGGLFKVPSPDEEESYLADKVKDKRKMRLTELKTLKLKNYKTDETKTELFENPSGTGVVRTANLFSMEKYASDEIVVSKEDMKKFEMMKVKDKIYIPQKLRKKGATYKVDDCYYDDDGEFLYRVPGMTG